MTTTDSAMNWYTSHLARALAGAGATPRILGPRRSGERTSTWRDGEIDVVACFERGSIRATQQISDAANREHSGILHLQHELFAYGGIAGAFFMPLMLRRMRDHGKRVLTTIHGVIPLASIDTEFVRGNGISAPVVVVRAMWRALIRAIARSSSAIHVHEQQHALWLREQYGLDTTPIYSVPLGLDIPETVPAKSAARRELGLESDARVVLFFGFHAQYKGLEILAREAPTALEADEHLHFVVAGGPPKRLNVTGSARVKELADLEARYGARFRLPGFVPEERVGMYFAAADALILPYTINMASSGPMSLALGYGLPVLMSDRFAVSYPGYVGTFSLRPGALAAKIREFFGSAELRGDAQAFLTAERERAAWPRVAADLVRIYQELRA